MKFLEEKNERGVRKAEGEGGGGRRGGERVGGEREAVLMIESTMSCSYTLRSKVAGQS